jgi:hypothetical protein
MKTIHLTKGYQAIVDDEIFVLLSAHKWHVVNYHPRVSYACRWIAGTKSPRKASRMHHEILGVDPARLKEYDLVVDHADRNGLNNQKANLSVVTRRENALNSDRSDNARGIYWDTVRGQYKVMQLQPNRRFICWSKTVDEAIYAQHLACT